MKKKGIGGMKVSHRGTKVSYEIAINKESDGLAVVFLDQSRVEINFGKELFFVLPSVEGSVLRCFFAGGTEGFFCPKTGKKLTQKELNHIMKDSGISFYC